MFMRTRVTWNTGGDTLIQTSVMKEWSARSYRQPHQNWRLSDQVLQINLYELSVARLLLG